MKIRFGLAFAALALAGAVQAHAAATENGDAALAEILPHVPRDADGKVSRETFIAYMESAFDRADPGKRGQIDPAKVKKAQVCQRMFGPRYVTGASLTGC